jgi:acyl CoA:acetate/3-ketoacid CoA transferase alpha subunit/acyl CoA:acetate/3-ketoacid CoA transferase beta subunit
MIDVETVRDRWRSLEGAGSGASKVTDLGAVREHVRTGDMLYFGGSMARPNAAMFEVARAFWSRNPGFTLAAPAVANQHAPLLRGNLVSKVVSSIHAYTFPSPAPHPLYIEAARNGSVVFEDWSLLTLVLGLMAGAMGAPFLPTRSLVGSDLGARLAADGRMAEVPDPFGGPRVPVVAAINPDVTFVHALAADAQGNALVCPPLYDDKWAAFAARRAVIVTAERIVNADFIRRYAAMVQLPAQTVTAVCEVPLGSHPNSLPGDLVPEIGGYPDDYDFLEDLREAGSSGAALDRWIETWLTGCESHWDYLDKLGERRIHALRGRARSDGWQFELRELAERRQGPATECERHVILATRQLTRRLQNGDIKAMLAGLGISSLAAWMAALRLRDNDFDIPLMVEAGMYGYLPVPGDPFLFNYRNMFTGSMLSDVVTTLGLLTAGPRNGAIGVLGAAQIDRRGDINTNELPNMLLTGSGGGNDIASGATDVLVTIAHSKKRLVEQVDFVTSPGRAVSTIVTPNAILQRRDGDYVLTHVLARSNMPAHELVAEATSGCGWPLPVADEIVIEPEPSSDEIELARLLDPKGYFLG